MPSLYNAQKHAEDVEYVGDQRGEWISSEDQH